MKNGKELAQIKTRRAGKFENRTVLSILAIFFAIVVVILLISKNGEYPVFITPVNLLNILKATAVPGMVAVGMTIVMIAGGIDLSVGMLASLVSIVTASGVMVWNLGVIPSVLLGILAAVALETLLGFIISRTNVEPFIITLGGMIAFQGAALMICSSHEVIMSGQLDPLNSNLIAGATDPFSGLNLEIPPYVIIFFIIVVFGWVLLKYTKYGRRVFAVGSNVNAAYLAGINVKNVKLSTYMINGALVGIAAEMMLSRIGTGVISLGQGMEITSIAMAVIGGTAMSGGKGNIWGTFIGVILFGSIGNALTMMLLPPEFQYVAQGAIIIIALTAGAVSNNISAYIMRKRNVAQAQQEAMESGK
jgi:Ribose/xylose/arabinose/galactoside ABC-type transport systems, permease components